MTYNPTKPHNGQLLDIMSKTWETDLVSVQHHACLPYSQISLKFLSHVGVDHTDGIGTKGIFHWKTASFAEAVQDAVAMNLNDLAMARARPYTMQDHIIIPNDDKEAIIKIVQRLADFCLEYRIALTGGETSIMNNMRGLDISLTVRGVVENNVGNYFKNGDILIGIASSGLHSNGFTKVREIFGNKFRNEYVVPTRIYWQEVHAAQKKYSVSGMSHITGGAFTKMKSFLQEVDVVITSDHSLKPHPIFYKLHKKGVSDEEMYRTFNCGIGFVLSVRPEECAMIMKAVNGVEIGRVQKGTGMVRIDSMFSRKNIVL